MSNNDAVVFPTVLSHMAKAAKLSAADYQSVSIPWEATFQRYFSTEGTMGVKYELFVRADEEHLSKPHVLTEGNFRNSKNLNSMGWKYGDIRPLIDKELEELTAIPVDADLFTTDRYDVILNSLIVRLCDYKGIDLANATKLLYQKRPALVPILDSRVRLVMGIHLCSTFEEVVTLAFKRFRELDRFGENNQVLAVGQSWLWRRADPIGALRFSKLRMIDILAWTFGTESTRAKLGPDSILAAFKSLSHADQDELLQRLSSLRSNRVSRSD